MPFTLTHVIAVVPLKKALGTRVPFSALAIGSMIPDMSMFFGFTGSYSVMHSLPGIFTACLPLGLITYALFQILVRTPLLEIMPQLVANKLGLRQPHTWRYWGSVVIAILLGACSHVVWDSFTHHNRWGSDLIPALTQVHEFFGVRMAGYAWFQHASSVVFLPLLGFLLWHWATRKPDAGTPTGFVYRSHLSLHLRTKILLLLLLFAAPAAYALAEAWLSTHSFYYGIGGAARAYGTYMVCTTLLYALITHSWLRLSPTLHRA